MYLIKTPDGKILNTELLHCVILTAKEIGAKSIMIRNNAYFKLLMEQLSDGLDFKGESDRLQKLTAVKESER